MAIHVLLLRGINVGGRNRLLMADLRAALAAEGFTDVATHIQSGNVVARSADGDPGAAAARAAAAIAARTGVAPHVVGRSAGQVRAVVADSPFLAAGADPAHLHAVFLADDDAAPDAPLLTDLDTADGEQVRRVGGELHLLLPHGMSGGKLATSLGRRLGPADTTRNWRTVTKLVAMVDALDATSP